MRGRLVYGLYRLAGAVVAWLPPRVAYQAATWVGWLLYALAPHLRRALADNMRHVLGPGAAALEVRACVRGICVNLIKGHYELFRLDRLSADQIKALVRIEGLEHAKRALDEGRGVVLVTPHFGNVDVVMQIPVLLGWPVLAVVQHIEPEEIYRYVLRLRTKHGLHMIPSDGPMLPLFRALKRGAIVGLACDRDVTDNAREVSFFGTPAWLPDGPVQVALRTGAPLIPAFALRLPDHSFAVHVEPPLTLQRSGDREADIVAGMEQVVARMEHWIGRYPDQWLVSAPIWRRERARPR